LKSYYVGAKYGALGAEAVEREGPVNHYNTGNKLLYSCVFGGWGVVSWWVNLCKGMN